MTRRLISTGSPFEKTIGYSRAVIQDMPGGRFAYVSGTTGYDYDPMEMPDDVAQQARNTFATIQKALHEAEMSLEHLTRVRYYLTKREYKDAVIPVFGEILGEIRPAATMVIADLMQPEMKIEIEADAFKAA